MKTIVFQSDSGSPDCPEWHMWRLGGIGGSDAPILAANAGLVKRAKWMDSIQTLWEMKTGKRGPKTANKAMIRGREYENAARVAYEHSTGNLVNSAFGEDDKLSFVRASFDGLSFDGNLIVEIKVPGEHTMKLVREGQIPEHYLPQLAHQAVVAWGEPGQSWVGNACHFAAYVPETRELKWLPADVQR
jgi:putative phage-type endonuclease